MASARARFTPPETSVYYVEPVMPQRRLLKVPSRGDCFGIEGRTWLVIGRFILTIFLMFLVQQWSDVQERPNNEICEIKDTFFLIIPNLPRVMDDSFSVHAADAWILIQLGVFFAWIALTSPNRQLWVRRWFTMWTYGYGLRALTVGLTFYYAPEFKDQEPFAADNPFYGALLLLLQLRSSLTDLMFSGHTMTWVLSARFVYYYAASMLFRSFYVAGAVLGPFLLIAVREHYSADVVVAVFVAYGVFEIYHLWYVRGYRERWLRTWEIEVDGPVRIVYPVRVQTAEGYEMVIGADRAGQVELIGAHVTPEREAWMQVTRYLDGDEIFKRVPL
jgi:hypothetical protein